MQDRVGVDVNVLLYCCWAAHDRGISFDTEAIERIASNVQLWKAAVVEPLRAIRQALKLAKHAGFDPDAQERLRTDIKRVELQSERLQQDALFAAAPPGRDDTVSMETRRQAATENIDYYMQTLATAIDRMTRDDIHLVVEAAFSETA